MAAVLVLSRCECIAVDRLRAMKNRIGWNREDLYRVNPANEPGTYTLGFYSPTSRIRVVVCSYSFSNRLGYTATSTLGRKLLHADIDMIRRTFGINLPAHEKSRGTMVHFAYKTEEDT